MQFPAAEQQRLHACGKLGGAHRTPALYVVNNSTRVHINDLRSGKLFLIDTGAEISVIPPSVGSRQPSDVHLTAANGTRIKTFGPKTLNLDLGLSRTFSWTFEMADVSRSIIGADFLHYFGLLVDVRRQRLVDPTDKRTVTCAVTTSLPSNAPLFTVARARDWDVLLQEFPSVTRESPVPEIFRHGVEHVLETRGPPLFARPRRLPPDRLNIARCDFDRMQKQGICRPSSSSWASPLLLVPKKDGSYRPCGDYRRLNSVTIPDRYPLPYLHDFTANLAKKTIFTKLDLVRAYNKFRSPPAMYIRPPSPRRLDFLSSQ